MAGDLHQISHAIGRLEVGLVSVAADVRALAADVAPIKAYVSAKKSFRKTWLRVLAIGAAWASAGAALAHAFN